MPIFAKGAQRERTLLTTSKLHRHLGKRLTNQRVHKKKKKGIF